MSKRLFLCLIVLGTLFFAGCNGNQPVKGTVRFSDDQSPLTAGDVRFESDAFSARGKINPDGTFQIGSLQSGDGVPLGTYKVFISGATAESGENEMGAVYLPLIEEKFTRKDMTPLTITVDRTTKKFDIEVTRAPSPKSK